MNTNYSPERLLNALIKTPKLYGALASSDNKWIAWSWLGISDTIDVYAVPTSGDQKPIRLSDTNQNTELVSWSPDNKSVVVAQDTDGNERNQLFQIFLDSPCVLHPLTPPNPPYFIRGGQLHPTTNNLIYGANFDFVNNQEIEPTWVYRHDLTTGEHIPLAQPTRGCWHFPQLNRTGSHILYNRNDLHPSGYQLWLVDIDGKSDRQIVSTGDDKKVFGSWFPDGERILIRAETDTHFKLGVWTLSSNELTWLIDDLERNIETAFVPTQSNKIIVVNTEEAKSKPSLLDIETGQEVELTFPTGNLIPVVPITEEHWIGKFYDAQHPLDLVRFSLSSLNSDDFTSVTHAADYMTFTSSTLTPAEDFFWYADDELRIHGWLYRSARPSKGTIVCVHGGPTAHSENTFDDQIQYFVSQGFTVLDPNYRGSTGYHRIFTEAIKKQGWGGAEQDDIRAGIEALIAAGIAQAGKVGITGTSYGGYSSWCAITRWDTSIIAASAPICGMTDLRIDYETTRPDLRPYTEEMMGGSPQNLPEKFHQRSPINFVHNIKGKLLIVQGEQDPNVTPENLHMVTKALDEHGIPYQTLTFPNEGHGIIRPENQKVLYQALINFFTRAFSDH